MNYEVVIGIEIHCELKTKTKMFSGAPSSFGNEANTNTNEIDLGHPGTLPSVNKEAVKKAIQACAALHLEIDPLIKFDRKNYYYSDLPKGYQITQQFFPIGKNGYVYIDDGDTKKKIRINRIHLEEDTAKQFHIGNETLIDFNRAGTPLIEIVSEPDMTSGKQAAQYVETLRQTLLYIGVSDVKMEEGSMRCDVNISLNKPNEGYGVKTEIKNLNSIGNVQKAIDYEIERQSKLLDEGKTITQATRRYDESTKTTIEMRKKGGSIDYKFFPEPNIFPIRLLDEWVSEIVNNLPELPEERKIRYKKDYNLSDNEINIYISNKELASLFENVMKYTDNAKAVSNWLITDVLAWLSKNNIDIVNCKLQPKELASLIKLIDEKVISNTQGKEVVLDGIMQGEVANDVIKNKGLQQVSDIGFILNLINEVLDEQPQSIIDYSNGKDRAVKFLVGQVMKKSKGQANPVLTNKLIIEELNKRINK
ncbi:MAG: Asp-tRNA(Asn)/Glu-tRNA(Gln) amidotransferase subunit GatB [Erysipelotrichaceae bacterium]|nr:Asp-tRNA(Asn)/Glu-tRNA(Gln) amidotransferase subunit GatB [Erysipelotrichaceae bacterium]